MKKTLFFILSLLFSFHAWAEIITGECGQEGSDITYTLDTSTGTITFSGTGHMAHFEYRGAPWYEKREHIKNIVFGTGIQSIGYYAFEGCTELNSVVIPQNINNLGYRAFQNCTGLKTVTIHDSLIGMGWEVFLGCNSLTEPLYNIVFFICLPINYEGAYATPNVYSTVSGAFDGCDKLTSLVINSQKIESGTIRNCSELTSITIGSSTEEIKAYAVHDTPKLSELVLMPATPPSIDSYSFSEHVFENVTLVVPSDAYNAYKQHDIWGKFNNISLIEERPTVVNVNTPGTLSSLLGNNIYNIINLKIVGSINGTDLATLRSMMGCDSENANLAYLDLYDATIVKGGEYRPAVDNNTLNSDNMLPGGVFENSKSIKSVVLPSGLRFIESFAFGYASKLQSVSLNEGLELIWDNAFVNTALQKIDIPSSVNTLGANIIIGCKNLKDISINPQNSYFCYDGYAIYTYNKEELVEVSPVFDGELIIDSNCKNVRRQAATWLDITKVIAPNVAEIGNNAFYYCNNLKTLAFGYKLQTIDYNVFGSCEAFENIYLGCLEVPTGNYKNYKDIEDLSNCNLYVPSPSIEKFKADSYWGRAKSIKAIEDTEYAYLAPQLSPVEGTGGSNFSEVGELNEDTNIDGNIIDNILFNINSDNGSYNANEGCIIVNKATEDNDFIGKDIFSDDFRDNFTGLVFKIDAGTGTISVDAESVGAMSLKIKIGDNTPENHSLTGKQQISINYNVPQPIYVYVYAGDTSTSAAKGNKVANVVDSLKIYGVSWSSTSTEIDSKPSVDKVSAIYNINGQKVLKPTKGLYIRGNKKIVIK